MPGAPIPRNPLMFHVFREMASALVLPEHEGRTFKPFSQKGFRRFWKSRNGLLENPCLVEVQTRLNPIVETPARGCGIPMAELQVESVRFMSNRTILDETLLGRRNMRIRVPGRISWLIHCCVHSRTSAPGRTIAVLTVISLWVLNRQPGKWFAICPSRCLLRI